MDIRTASRSNALRAVLTMRPLERLDCAGPALDAAARWSRRRNAGRPEEEALSRADESRCVDNSRAGGDHPCCLAARSAACKQ